MTKSVQVPDGTGLILATHNEHKVQELKTILAPLVSQWNDSTVISASGLDIPEPVEDGMTFSDNSLLKARAIVAATGLPAVADDSGLCVSILGGAPGIFSARWCGRHGDDQGNMELLLNQLADVPEQFRQASFISAAALVTPGGKEIVKIGKLSGTLGFAPAGNNGFGYDPIFYPEGSSLTTAEMEPSAKNAISHRGISFRALSDAIVQVLDTEVQHA